MSMLGAALDDLTVTGDRAREAADGAIQTGTETATAIKGLDDDFNGLATTVAATVDGALAALQGVVDTLNNQAGGANWTGRNRDVYVQQSGEAQQACTALIAEGNEVVTSARTTCMGILADLNGYMASYDAILKTQVSGNFELMQQAVVAQRDNLDAVMNA